MSSLGGPQNGCGAASSGFDTSLEGKVSPGRMCCKMPRLLSITGKLILSGISFALAGLLAAGTILSTVSPVGLPIVCVLLLGGYLLYSAYKEWKEPTPPDAPTPTPTPDCAAAANGAGKASTLDINTLLREVSDPAKFSHFASVNVIVQCIFKEQLKCLEENSATIEDLLSNIEKVDDPELKKKFVFHFHYQWSISTEKHCEVVKLGRRFRELLPEYKVESTLVTDQGIYNCKDLNGNHAQFGVLPGAVFGGCDSSIKERMSTCRNMMFNKEDEGDVFGDHLLDVHTNTTNFRYQLISDGQCPQNPRIVQLEGRLKQFLDKYNNGKSEDEKVEYNLIGGNNNFFIQSAANQAGRLDACIHHDGHEFVTFAILTTLDCSKTDGMGLLVKTGENKFSQVCSNKSADDQSANDQLIWFRGEVMHGTAPANFSNKRKQDLLKCESGQEHRKLLEKAPCRMINTIRVSFLHNHSEAKGLKEPIKEDELNNILTQFHEFLTTNKS